MIKRIVSTSILIASTIYYVYAFIGVAMTVTPAFVAASILMVIALFQFIAIVIPIPKCESITTSSSVVRKKKSPARKKKVTKKKAPRKKKVTETLSS